MNHTLYVVLLIFPNIFSLVTAAIIGLEMSTYAREIPTMKTVAHLARFKRMAAHNMYAALALLALMLLPWALYLYGWFTRILKPGDFLIVIVASAITFGLGRMLKKVEENVQTLPVEDIRIKAERDRVVDTWMHKMFPDWR